jgi:glycosyltransferase involved in cell wall biosynthesis
VGGIPELIRHNVDGILVMPSDHLGLAHAIERLMDEPDLRRKLGAAGRDRVMEDYDLDRNTSRLARIFLARIPGLSLPIQGSCGTAFAEKCRPHRHADTVSN